MECRLCCQALLPMIFALAGDHSFAQEHLGALDRSFFHEVVVLYYQHFSDVVRMIQKDNVLWANLVVCDVPEATCQIFEQMNRIVRPELSKGKPEQVVLKPWGKSVRRCFTLQK